MSELRSLTPLSLSLSSVLLTVGLSHGRQLVEGEVEGEEVGEEEEEVEEVREEEEDVVKLSAFLCTK